MARRQQHAVLDAATPTLEHIQYLFGETMFPTWLWNTMFIALASTADLALLRACSPATRCRGSTSRSPAASAPAIFVTYLVPQTLLFIPLADIIRNFQLGDTPWALILTYPTFLIPFCTWLMMGYFKTIPKELEECARIDGAIALAGAMVHIIFPVAMPGHPVGRHLRLHAVVERVHLRARVPVLAPSRRPCRSASSRS